MTRAGVRALGLDLGSKRVGVAIGDRTGTIASPLLVLQRTGSLKRDHEAIARLVIEASSKATYLCGLSGSVVVSVMT